MRILTALTVALVMAASAMGAVITVTDIASSDVPTPAMTAFPVPAAAPWSGAKNLIFDNSAAGLAFSTTPYPTGNVAVAFPLVNSAVTISPVDTNYAGDKYGNGPLVTGINNSLSFYTNTQGSAGATGADNRYPYNIARPGRDCGQDFSCVSFALAQTATEFGVFLPCASNNSGGAPLNDYNYQQANYLLDVYVLGAGDTFTTADHYQVAVAGFCPFLNVADASGIDSVVVVDNAGWQNGPTYGFMDVYSNVPEPATLSVLALGAMSLIRRRK